MLSVHLQQMVAGSNGPASCVEDLSEHLYHAQVHLMRSTTECEDISIQRFFQVTFLSFSLQEKSWRPFC